MAILGSWTAYQNVRLVPRQVKLATVQTRLAVTQTEWMSMQRELELPREKTREMRAPDVDPALPDATTVERVELPPRGPIHAEISRTASRKPDRIASDVATLSARVAEVRRRMLAQSRVDPAGARRAPEFFALARQARAAEGLTGDDCRWIRSTGNEIYRTLGADIAGGTFRLDDRDELLCAELRSMECVQ